MKKIKEFLKSEKFITLLTSILFIFVLFYAIFMAYHDETAKIENNYESVEIEKQDRQPIKKSLVSAENNNYYAYLYLDFANEVYVKADIYYSYSVDETNGDLLVVIVNSEYEYTDTTADYTYTSSYTYSFTPKINNNTDFINITNIASINFKFSLIRYQSSRYILPNIYITFSYAVDDSLKNYFYEGNAGFDEGFIITENYNWDDDNKLPFNINDTSFHLFNLISDSYYNAGYKTGFDDGKVIGFEEGKQAQKDLYSQNDTALNKIWTILENGIKTALNVLSIEILPGIPLTICIIVPLIFGIIFFIWKGGAQ